MANLLEVGKRFFGTKIQKRVYSIVTCLVFTALMAHAQLVENFTDGNYTANPVWTPSTATDWFVNPDPALQSNNMVANSSFYISTPNTLALQTQWEFYAKLTFNPSGNNYADVYLTANAANLSLPATTGYFVRIGNTDDEISLYRKDANGTAVKIIDGINGILNTSSNILKIKVTRNAANQWMIQRDLTGTGNAYISEGTVTDATFTTASFFGILVVQSTASFFQRHFFDDIEIKPFVPDVTPPAIVNATAVSANTLDVLFTETVDVTTAQILANYTVNNGVGQPTAAVRDAVNTALVHLSFASNFPNINCQLIVNGVQDVSANTLNNGTAIFRFYNPTPYDIVIDEIMADPTPQVALPNAEWVELRNTTATAINLNGWRLGDAGGITGPMPSFNLLPDSVVIICTASATPLLASFGNVISVTSFPSLDNNGKLIFLRSPAGATIHAVDYSINWYQNVVKADGGWTLEMIDTKNPCSGAENWRASTDSKGGTPAKKNAIDGSNRDQISPRVVRAFATDNLNFTIVFDEPLDSLKAATAANYTVSDGIGTPMNAIAIGPLFNRVSLKTATPLVANKVYTITVKNITDCVGNAIGSSNQTIFGLPTLADSLDLVVNEILFNPKSTGNDYVEIYNRSNKIIDLKNVIIANRSSTTGAIGSIKNLSVDSYLLFPGAYIVATENAAIIKAQFLAKTPDAFTEITLPSYPDDAGFVVILNSNGKIIDALNYSSKWHFALIDNEEGIALERIDFDKPTNEPSNWTSAASTVGFGTPTYQNSQYKANLQPQGEIKILPPIFSPDNDGFDDFALLYFNFTEPGFVVNITIYDAAGRPVRVLQKNATAAASGSFRWDGLNDKQGRVPIGIYVVHTEIFNLKGQKKNFKNTVVVARKF